MEYWNTGTAKVLYGFMAVWLLVNFKIADNSAIRRYSQPLSQTTIKQFNI
jgi:hypothetical protein